MRAPRRGAGHGDDVVGRHRDRVALQEARAAGVEHDHVRSVARERVRDLGHPDRVAREVQRAAVRREHEAGDRGEHARRSSRCRAGRRCGRRPGRGTARVLDRHQRPEPVALQPLDVGRLAEHRHAAGQEPDRRLVQMVRVQVRDHDAVEPRTTSSGGSGRRDRRVRDGVGRVADGRARARLVEHRVDQQPLAAELDEEGRMADERQAHAATIERRVITARVPPRASSGRRRRAPAAPGSAPCGSGWSGRGGAAAGSVRVNVPSGRTTMPSPWRQNACQALPERGRACQPRRSATPGAGATRPVTASERSVPPAARSAREPRLDAVLEAQLCELPLRRPRPSVAVEACRQRPTALRAHDGREASVGANRDPPGLRRSARVGHGEDDGPSGGARALDELALDAHGSACRRAWSVATGSSGRPSMVATARSDAPGAGATSTPALVATVGGPPAAVPAFEAVTRQSIVAPTSAEPVT